MSDTERVRQYMIEKFQKHMIALFYPDRVEGALALYDASEAFEELWEAGFLKKNLELRGEHDDYHGGGWYIKKEVKNPDMESSLREEMLQEARNYHNLIDPDDAYFEWEYRLSEETKEIYSKTKVPFTLFRKEDKIVVSSPIFGEIEADSYEELFIRILAKKEELP